MRCRAISNKTKKDINIAIKNEMLSQVDEWQRKYNIDMYSNILYTVRKETEKAGDAWGKERLTRLFKKLAENYDRFRKDYDFEDTYAERVKLKEECGLDVEQVMVDLGLLPALKERESNA